MHIRDLDQVGYLYEKRKIISEKILECAGTLNVLISGRYQEPEFVEAARPAVMALLNEQLGAIDERLREYGVTVD